MLQGRLIAYQDAHRYRVGVNYNQLPVNAAKCPVNHYQRDGAMAGLSPAGGNHHQTSGANYFPNDRDNAPKPATSVAEPAMPVEAGAWLDRFDTDQDDHYTQAGNLFRIMSEDQKQQLADNIAGGLGQCDASIQQRMLAQFEKADPDYAARVAAALKA